jgi:hypothetical protein
VNCLLCHSDHLEKVVDLGPTPLANKLVKNASKNSLLYPLQLVMCQDCGHVQLSLILDTNFVFSEYPYRSNTGTTSMIRLKELSSNLISSHVNESNSGPIKVFEIGSNDGSLLNFLKKLGCVVLGIDPASEAVAEARSIGIETIHSFFSLETIDSYPRVIDEWDFIIINNVLAHTNNVSEILNGISVLMSNKTRLVIEFSYLVDILEKNLFDTIYHEHVSYFSLTSLTPILSRFGLEILKVERFDAHGGSLRVFAVKKNSGLVADKSFTELLKYEQNSNILSTSSWKSFERQIQGLRFQVSNILSFLKQNNTKVVGYGVPAKFSTMFYGLGLSPNLFDYFVDDNQNKVGKLVPGLNIEVQSVVKLFETQPEYIFVFCWNYIDDVKDFVNKKCVFVKSIVVPLPSFKVIETNHNQ